MSGENISGLIDHARKQRECPFYIFPSRQEFDKSTLALEFLGNHAVIKICDLSKKYGKSIAVGKRWVWGWAHPICNRRQDGLAVTTCCGYNKRIE
jgi:hypothetical protein